MAKKDTQTRPLGAQISHMLKSRGVDTIFGIPGVHNQEMYRGIEEAGITHVLARHEQGAGFMADGYARASGRPGVAYVITGPGLCNIMTPMGQAYSDSVPLLVLSSCLDETANYRGQLHQMLDQEGAARTVCDWSHEARDAASAYALIDRALQEFTLQRPRTKHVQVPIAALEGEAEAAPDLPQPVSRSFGDLPGGMAQRIMSAKRPLFVLGGGARGDVEAAREVIGKMGAASIATVAGRGVMPRDYPLNYGGFLGRPESAEVAQGADLVVVVGSELAEVDLWRRELGYEGEMIRVDIDPEVLSQPGGGQGVLMDSGAFFRALQEAMEDGDAAGGGWNADEVAAQKKRWRAALEAERPGIPRVVDALQAVMPEDAMIFSDMTQFAYVSNEMWDMPQPGHWHHPTGFGTLGYAMPAAIGGAVARRGKPTVAIAGDYGFQYTVQELGAAVELGLPLPILLWDNGKLKEIEDSMVGAQIAPNSVIAHNPDFPALARAYGAHAETPQSLPALQDALLKALEADKPTLIYMTGEMTD
ncbi:acetolactate synthase isozyme1 large subunit [Roseovarius sp. SCSIO 43702]|uniref:thiamine pyrophosphate-binding protein n=1 Tax=Roseovarius sp. SCSIO 43702 TaxID=2823043 RepID=UPI001C73A818|nr:thiamine pyrophosphate-binding protein [Roseovarius sp. SCSIO 43702]QYX57173.1 acetolactate synthase isozyme1 large subunit [Roseovarius sp. SCSIO 43702]